MAAAPAKKPPVKKAEGPLTRKFGPLPAWGWLGIGGIGIYAYRKYEAGKSGAATGTAANAVSTPAAYPSGYGGYDSGAGGGGGATPTPTSDPNALTTNDQSDLLAGLLSAFTTFANQGPPSVVVNVPASGASATPGASTTANLGATTETTTPTPVTSAPQVSPGSATQGGASPAQPPVTSAPQVSPGSATQGGASPAQLVVAETQAVKTNSAAATSSLTKAQITSAAKVGLTAPAVKQQAKAAVSKQARLG